MTARFFLRWLFGMLLCAMGAPLLAPRLACDLGVLMSAEAMGARRLAGASCCVCAREAGVCVDESHREFCGVVQIAAGKWICQPCAGSVSASWARATKAAL